MTCPAVVKVTVTTGPAVVKVTAAGSPAVVRVATPGPVGPQGPVRQPDEVRIDTTTTANTIYAGTAVNGSTDAAVVWKVTRSIYNPAGQRTSKGVATDVTWTGRAGHTYS